MGRGPSEWWRRRVTVYDVVSPTEAEARDADIARRRRRYLLVMGAVVLLFVSFGYLLPVPTWVRVAVLVPVALVPPVAAFLANRHRT
ncbi:DUF3099 domain-containing protein [Thalassiella azotivora]